MRRSITEELDDIAEDFDVLGDWQEQLGHVIDLGRELEPLRDGERVDANKLRGCASQVWLIAERLADGRVAFRADSDAQIPKGLIAVLLKLYSGRTPAEITAVDPQVAADRQKLGHMLTQQRASGLAAMAQRIRAEAARPA